LQRRLRTVAALSAATFLSATPALAKPAEDTARGPSTTTDPYVLPAAEGVRVTSLLTVEDGRSASNGYEMVGIPDGLGAFQRQGRGFTLLMNQELRDTQGIPRRHGQRGAFVSNLRIDRHTLEVTEGRDHINPGVRYWDYVSQTYRATPSSGGPNPRNPGDLFPPQLAAFSRFCSGTLSEERQLFNRRSGRGYDGQLYFANEENGDEGRLFGVTEDGQAQQLPRVGLFSWENSKPAFTRSDRTVVIGNEDGAAGQLWVYAGVKRRAGTPFDRAGLTNGSTSVIDAVDPAITDDVTFRSNPNGGKGKPVPVTLNTVDWDQSGAAQNRESARDGLSLNRIEDGHFDPRNRNDYYFLTTEGGGKQPDPTDSTNASRDGGGLWRLSLEDVDHPELGGTLTLLLDGTEAPYLNKPDNMTIDDDGNLLIQEDPGGNPHVARIVAYDIATGRRGVVAQFDRDLFASGRPGFITQDEESSGIIDADQQLGDGWFLFDAQVHAPAANPEYVEKGQLLAMKVDSFKRIYG